MRVIVIDPDSRFIGERDIVPSVEVWQNQVGGYFANHPAVPDCIPDHMCFVNEEGIREKQKFWWFNRQMIWGPMIIFTCDSRGNETPARVSVDAVQRFVSFEHPGWS